MPKLGSADETADVGVDAATPATEDYAELLLLVGHLTKGVK